MIRKGMPPDPLVVLHIDPVIDCEEKFGACRLYDRKSLMYTFLAAHIVYKVLGISFWLGCLASYKPVKMTKCQEIQYNAKEVEKEAEKVATDTICHIPQVEEDASEKSNL